MGGVLSVGDFNGDAKPDLAVVTDPSYLRLFLGDGTGIHERDKLRPAPDRRRCCNRGYGDGKADVVIATGGSSVSVFAGNGDGTYLFIPTWS